MAKPNRFKPVSISLSPNVQTDDVLAAFGLLRRPWRWRRGNAALELERRFAEYLGVRHAISFNSGRSAFFAILKALDLPQGSAVGLQAFTCNAVPNPMLWAGLKPIYIDCANDFNMDIGALKRQAERVPLKALVVQHTFGLPANLDAMLPWAQERGIPVIEDCAHALGADYQFQSSQELWNKRAAGKVGTFGKAAFFSFSRDKVISCVYGGMAVTDDGELAKKIRAEQEAFGLPSAGWVLQQLLHPVLVQYLILPLYAFFDLGKILLVLSQWLRVLSKAVSWKEKRGVKPDYFPKALPNALAVLALRQFSKLDSFYRHRKQLAEFYARELSGTSFGLPDMREGQSFLRFSVTHPNARDVTYEAWHRRNILLGDWYTSVIAPADTKLDEMQYEPGSCPNAERLAGITLNLPTHINISMADAQRIVNFLKQ